MLRSFYWCLRHILFIPRGPSPGNPPPQKKKLSKGTLPSTNSPSARFRASAILMPTRGVVYTPRAGGNIGHTLKKRGAATPLKHRRYVSARAYSPTDLHPRLGPKQCFENRVVFFKVWARYGINLLAQTGLCFPPPPPSPQRMHVRPTKSRHRSATQRNPAQPDASQGNPEQGQGNTRQGHAMQGHAMSCSERLGYGSPRRRVKSGCWAPTNVSSNEGVGTANRSCARNFSSSMHLFLR